MTYYTTTLGTAFSKIGPVILFIVVGYVAFIKLPFLFYFKVVTSQKEASLQDPGTQAFGPKDTDLFLEGQKKPEPAQEKARPQQRASEESARRRKPAAEETQSHRKEEQKKREEPRKEARKPDPSPESLFDLRPGQAYSKKELKKKYHDLLKANHPDKVASLGGDLRTLAEKRTKDINMAYEKLRNRAS